MKILFLSYFFEPDLSAGSFRNTSLFRTLLEKVGREDFIHVITTLPNRYITFDADCKIREDGENYRIDRIKVPRHASGMLEQIISFITYYRQVWKLTAGGYYDLVYASSSRLFTAFLGRRCAVKKHCPLYLDIRDIFADTIKDLFKDKIFISIPLSFILKIIENHAFGNATHINLISGGFENYFIKWKKPSYSFYSNGIDDLFLDAGREPSSSPAKPYVITYAGNIGSGQGLEKIIPYAAMALGSDYKFRIIGDGSTRDLLENRLKEMNVGNVEILKPLPREELIEYYRQSAFLFFHLNDFDAFKKVLPSKMFEYGAFDKPVLAGVGGYARDFVEKNIPNHILFAPTDADDFVRQMRSYVIRFEKREEFRKNFSRRNINLRMADNILSKSKQK